MDVVRLACASPTDVVALLVLPEHEVGDAEGLARWNGREWKWIERRNSWTLDLDRYRSQWAALEFAGQITFFNETSGPRKTDAGWNGLNAFYIHESTIYVVGINGGFLRFDSESWQRINHPIQNHLYSVCGSHGTVYACGARGSIISYDGSLCRSVDLSSNHDLTSISCSIDGSTFAVGAERETGVLVNVRNCRLYPLPSRQHFIKVVSASEVYGIDLDGAVWYWNGEEAVRSSISNKMHALCFGRSEEVLAIGGRDVIAVSEGGVFHVVPIQLESSYLDRE